MRRFLLKGSGLLLALLFTCTLFQSCNKDEMKWDEPDYTVKDKMEMQKAGPVDLEGMMPNDIYSCNESGPDGFTDLKLKFDTQSVMDALGRPRFQRRCVARHSGPIHSFQPKTIFWERFDQCL